MVYRLPLSLSSHNDRRPRTIPDRDRREVQVGSTSERRLGKFPKYTGCSRKNYLRRAGLTLVSLAVLTSSFGTPCRQWSTHRTARTHARTQSTHAGFVYKSCLFRVCYRSSLTRNPSETTMWFFTLHIHKSHARFVFVFPFTRPCHPPLPPSFLAYLSTLPFALSIISIHCCCLANRVDREAVSVDSQPLVNHATVIDENESPAIIVRIIETRWMSTPRSSSLIN